MTLSVSRPAAMSAADTSQPTGILFDIRKYSIHDGPGIRTAVFFKGCPLRCIWCHNPESQSFEPELILRPGRCIGCGECVDVCPQGAIEILAPDSAIVTDRTKCQACGECTQVCYAEGRQLIGRRYSLEQVWVEIESDLVFYEQSGGGVTFTGGEPMSQRPFLLALLHLCKAGGLHTALDTSGYCSWEALDEVRPLVDLFLYDLKLMDETRHRQYTGVSNALILSNLQALSRLGHAIRVRIPIIPGLNDNAENLRLSGEFLSRLPALERVDLLPYHASAEAKYQNLGQKYHLSGLKSPSEERMQEIAAMLCTFGLTVGIGG